MNSRQPIFRQYSFFSHQCPLLPDFPNFSIDLPLPSNMCYRHKLFLYIARRCNCTNITVMYRMAYIQYILQSCVFNLITSGTLKLVISSNHSRYLKLMSNIVV